MKPLLFITLIIIAAFIAFLLYAQSPNLSSEDQYYTLAIHHGNYAQPTDTLKVMTFNVGYLSGMTNNLPEDRPYSLFDANHQQAVSLLKTLTPDIIGFQEIDFDADRSFNINQHQTLATALDYPNSYLSVNWDKAYVPFPYWPPADHFGKIISGQSIASQFKITDYRTIVLVQPEGEHLMYNSFYIDRLVQIVDLEVGDQIIKVMNVHLEAFQKETRIKQAYVVKDLFETYAQDMPVILIGDFNSLSAFEVKDNEAMKIIMSAKHIRSSVEKSAYEADKRGFLTYSSRSPQIMIDYILYNDNFLSCISASVMQAAGEISDHLPLMSTLVIKRQID